MEIHELRDENATAQFMDLAVVTLKMWRTHRVRQGPPFIKVGKRTVRYRRDDLLAYLESRKVLPRSDF